MRAAESTAPHSRRWRLRCAGWRCGSRRPRPRPPSPSRLSESNTTTRMHYRQPHAPAYVYRVRPCITRVSWNNSRLVRYVWWTNFRLPDSFWSHVKYRFLRASAMLKHLIDIGWTSVCLSVRPSVTRWHCIKTAEYIVMLSSPHDSPFILVFFV